MKKTIILFSFIIIGLISPLGFNGNFLENGQGLIVHEARAKVKDKKITNKEHKKNLKYLLKKGVTKSFILSVYKKRIGGKKKDEILKKWNNQKVGSQNNNQNSKEDYIDGLVSARPGPESIKTDCQGMGSNNFSCTVKGYKSFLILNGSLGSINTDGNKGLKNASLTADFNIYSTKTCCTEKKNLLYSKHLSSNVFTKEVKDGYQPFITYSLTDYKHERLEEPLDYRLCEIEEIILHTPEQGDFIGTYCTLTGGSYGKPESWIWETL